MEVIVKEEVIARQSPEAQAIIPLLLASCETDLARQFPLAVVAKWLGTTQAVAMRHYVDVTDADFERATMGTETADEKAAQNQAQQPQVLTRSKSHAVSAAHKKTLFCKAPRLPAIPRKTGEWRRRESNANLDCGNELEHNELSVDEPANSANASRIVGPSGHELSLADTSLLRLIKAWWRLPPHIQQAIVTLIDATIKPSIALLVLRFFSEQLA